MEDKDKPADVVPEPSETTPAPDATPPTVPEPSAPKDDTRELVEALVSRVDALSETVKGLVEVGTDAERDTTPVKLPWTHRPFFGMR